ncbi:Transcriptional regulator, IclR family [Desulfonema limicola]|uniref:Transcriptional regulator, IclR family n=1 Tax=Desulfonema limicola TaxID=45656 RepID=A0A975GGA7_9BACT|nr:IclR family transcriptional regulator [Desulfonema limicola]QTA80096.1 Transcriptional regulator, IclR family [Desulfonema limicola]
MKSDSGSLSSTEKALKILMSFTPNNHETGTLELSKKLDIHKSTVSRLLHLLTNHDFLHQNPETKKYMLGRSAAEIGNAVIRSLNNSIADIARPFLNKLSQNTGESVALEMVSGNNVILACQVEGQRHLRFSFELGEQVPVNVTAGAKTILAFSNKEFVEQCLKQKFTRFNSNTIISKKEYRKLLEEIRKTGIAYDKGERYEGTHAIAAPVFNHEKVPVAAVVIAGPAFRMTQEFLNNVIEPLKKTSAEISKRLFY